MEREAALPELREKAEAGDPEAFANGETGSVDREKALQYLQLAWDHGNTAAYHLMRSLGVRPT